MLHFDVSLDKKRNWNEIIPFPAFADTLDTPLFRKFCDRLTVTPNYSSYLGNWRWNNNDILHCAIVTGMWNAVIICTFVCSTMLETRWNATSRNVVSAFSPQQSISSCTVNVNKQSIIAYLQCWVKVYWGLWQNLAAGPLSVFAFHWIFKRLQAYFTFASVSSGNVVSMFRLFPNLFFILSVIIIIIIINM